MPSGMTPISLKCGGEILAQRSFPEKSELLDRVESVMKSKLEEAKNKIKESKDSILQSLLSDIEGEKKILLEKLK